MSWQVKQTRRFERVYKKLHKNVAAEVDNAVAAIAKNPDIGEQKKVILFLCGCINFVV